MTSKITMNMMQIFDSNDTKAYRTCCSCHSDDHTVETWIEVGDVKEDISDFGEISIAFYVKTVTPWWDKKFNRFKVAWKVLTSGYHEESQYFLMNEDTATLFINTISEDIETLRQVKQERFDNSTNTQ